MVALAPEQIVPSSFVLPEVSVTAMDGVGRAFTVIVCEVVAVQPSAFVIVTVYVVFKIGETVIAAVVWDGVVLQEYVSVIAPPLAVSVALSPVQIVPSSAVFPEVSATVIIGVGSGLTVIVWVEVAVHPSALVTVTV